jgi:hypothetical protein
MSRPLRNRARSVLNRFYKSTEDHFCAYCGALLLRLGEENPPPGHGKPATADHMNPICRGGPDSDENIVLSCAPCNGRKGHLNWDEYWCVKDSNSELYREKQRVAYELGFIRELFDSPEQAALGRFERRQAVLLAEGRIKDPEPDCEWCHGTGFTNKIQTKYCRCSVIGEKRHEFNQRGKKNKQRVA